MAAAIQSEDEIMTAINITPLVDIFLVLLIIFMITSSVVDQKQIPVNLPKAAHAGTEAPKASGLVVDRDRHLFLDGELRDSAQICVLLKQAVAVDEEHQVLIGADEDLPYREVVGVIDMIRGAGVRKYALKVSRAGT
ncbi:MAG: Biopolymer transport protein ExbD/TolR [Fibrobacteres bacterium]|nr:Biopolymer transport protein ExbD/TolR [Fibrobacterota bacterium]